MRALTSSAWFVAMTDTPRRDARLRVQQRANILTPIRCQPVPDRSAKTPIMPWGLPLRNEVVKQQDPVGGRHSRGRPDPPDGRLPGGSWRAESVTVHQGGV